LLILEIRPDAPVSLPADAVVHLLFEDEPALPPSVAEIDARLDGIVSELVATGEAKGKIHETHVIATLRRIPARRVLILGAGKRAELTDERVEHLFGQAAREADHRGWASVVVGTTAIRTGTLPVEACLHAAATGAVVGLARGDLYKTTDRPEPRLESLIFADPEATSAWEAALNVGRAVGEGVNFARELVFQPPGDMTPTVLGERARALARQHGLDATTLDRGALEELGANALLAVARGSA